LPAVIDVADREAVIPRIARREIRPALRQDRTEPQGPGRLNQHPTGLLGGPPAAKTQVDGRCAVGEKILKVIRQRRRILRLL